MSKLKFGDVVVDPDNGKEVFVHRTDEHGAYAVTHINKYLIAEVENVTEWKRTSSANKEFAYQGACLCSDNEIDEYGEEINSYKEAEEYVESLDDECNCNCSNHQDNGSVCVCCGKYLTTEQEIDFFETE